MSQQLSSALLRTCARQQLPTTVTRSAAIAAGQQRGVANAGAKFESPFASAEDPTATLKVPSFKKYMSKSSPTTNKVFSYFVAGTMGLGSAVGAKATVQGASTLFFLFVYLFFLIPSNDGITTASNGYLGAVWCVSVMPRLTIYRDYRLPRQHVRFCRCPGPGQGRNCSRLHSRGQERASPTTQQVLTTTNSSNRSSSNGVASPSSSVTVPATRLRKPTTLTGRLSGILSPMRIVSRSPSG